MDLHNAFADLRVRSGILVFLKPAEVIVSATYYGVAFYACGYVSTALE